MLIREVGRLFLCNGESNLDKFVKNASVTESVSIKWLLECTNAETNFIYKNKYKEVISRQHK